ncbi:MAG: hypothetical protein P8L37_01650 [Phycisphaerales bacterium]|nr:hypothetical protein [Phycisphaerales bacterium]
MITSPSIGPAYLRRERVVQPWRVCLVIYTLLIIITTHWPGSPPEAVEPRHYFPDKLIHFLAFGGFVLLLWSSGWSRTWWAASLIGVAFVLVDEWTQSLFASNRHASGEDMAAGMLGVLTASGWMTALATPETHGFGSRSRRLSFAFETFLEQPSNILRLLVVASIPLLIVAVLIYVIAWNLFHASMGNLALTLGLLASLLAMNFFLRHRMRSVLNAIEERKPCFACGESMKSQTSDEYGWHQCTACGEEAHRSQWMPITLPRVSLRMIMTVDGPSGIACLMLYVLLGLVFGPYALLVSGQSGLAGAILFTSLGLLAAMLWSWRSQRLGSWFQSMGVRCAQCGEDLTGITADRGMGHCPQCDTDFARFQRQQDDEKGIANNAHTPSNA